MTTEWVSWLTRCSQLYQQSSYLDFLVGAVFFHWIHKWEESQVSRSLMKDTVHTGRWLEGNLKSLCGCVCGDCPLGDSRHSWVFISRLALAFCFCQKQILGIGRKREAMPKILPQCCDCLSLGLGNKKKKNILVKKKRKLLLSYAMVYHPRSLIWILLLVSM